MCLCVRALVDGVRRQHRRLSPERSSTPLGGDVNVADPDGSPIVVAPYGSAAFDAAAAAMAALPLVPARNPSTVQPTASYRAVPLPYATLTPVGPRTHVAAVRIVASQPLLSTARSVVVTAAILALHTMVDRLTALRYTFHDLGLPLPPRPTAVDLVNADEPDDPAAVVNRADKAVFNFHFRQSYGRGMPAAAGGVDNVAVVACSSVREEPVWRGKPSMGEVWVCVRCVLVVVCVVCVCDA